MKVFKVWVDKCDYGTYDSFVCVANSEDEIRNCITFYDFQGEIHIEEVNLNVDKPYIVCSSYNAG